MELNLYQGGGKEPRSSGEERRSPQSIQGGEKEPVVHTGRTRGAPRPSSEERRSPWSMQGGREELPVHPGRKREAPGPSRQKGRSPQSIKGGGDGPLIHGGGCLGSVILSQSHGRSEPWPKAVRPLSLGVRQLCPQHGVAELCSEGCSLLPKRNRGRGGSQRA